LDAVGLDCLFGVVVCSWAVVNFILVGLILDKQQRMSTDDSSSNQPNVGMVNQPQPFQINN
jgi:hypothetical protein